MRKPEWPGIATAVGIILIIAIVVAITSDFPLKDWQTIGAGALAFIGGVLAYRGAMAKVDHDAALSKRELLRRQLGLYLKLELAVRHFSERISGLCAELDFLEDGDDFWAGRLKLTEPPEIAEAWDNLDVYPRRLIREIASIRQNLRRIDLELSTVTTGRIPSGGSTLGVITGSIHEVHNACTIVAHGLENEIDKLAPRLPENDRKRAMHGEPDDED